MLIHKTINNFTSSLSKPVEGSPKKRFRSEVPLVSSSAPNTSAAPGNFAVPKAPGCQVMGMENSSQEKVTCDFRRDSLAGDQAHLEHLARITANVFLNAWRQNTSHAMVRQMSIHDVEEEQQHLCPKVDGRILKVDKKTIDVMLQNKMSDSQNTHSLVDEVIRENSVTSQTSVTSGDED